MHRNLRTFSHYTDSNIRILNEKVPNPQSEVSELKLIKVELKKSSCLRVGLGRVVPSGRGTENLIYYVETYFIRDSYRKSPGEQTGCPRKEKKRQDRVVGERRLLRKPPKGGKQDLKGGKEFL